jgi:hypothetical protein
LGSKSRPTVCSHQIPPSDLPQLTQAPTGAYINVPPMGPEELREK